MEKNTTQGTAPDQKTTRAGKIRATYTLLCEFNDGNTFTYRSDDALAEFTNKGYKYITELDALLLKYKAHKNKLQDCKLFDNRLPKKEDLLLHYSGMLKKILINNLPQRYSL